MALLLLGYGPDGVAASEFGNIFGNTKATEQSRAASAKALEGIGQVIEGLRQRELGTSNGAENLKSAAKLLRDASAAMKTTLTESGDFPEIALADKVPADLRQAIARSGSTFGVNEPQTLAELYGNFAQITLQIADQIEKNAEGGPNPVFPEISTSLSYYFDYASQTTRAAQIASPK